MIPSRAGYSVISVFANLEYVCQSFRWCIKTGPMKTGGFLIALRCSFRFSVHHHRQAHIFFENIKCWVNT
jgi:hypothetical protein